METVLISGIVALGGAVGILWKNILSNQSRTETKLDECEDDRKNLRDTLCHLTVRVEDIETAVSKE